MSTTDTIMLDILEQLRVMTGRMAVVETKLDAGSDRHKEFKEAIEKLEDHASTINTKVSEMKPIVEKVGTMDVRVQKLERFHGKFGAIMGVASAVFMGVAYLIWEAIKWMLNDGSAVLKRFFS
jgi:hypothetical protein